MIGPSLTDIVKKDAYLEHYQNGQLTYNIDGLRFVVDCKDLGEARVGVKEKGITLMRWIRPALENLRDRG